MMAAKPSTDVNGLHGWRDAGMLRNLDHEIAFYRDHLDQQRLRYDGLKHRSMNFFHKTSLYGWQKDQAEIDHAAEYGELSEKEIELELLKRKEALGCESS